MLQTFYRVVHEGTLRHRGDPVIAAHLANCAVERGFRDEIRRVRKIDERKPIDAVPAMALAVSPLRSASHTRCPEVPAAARCVPSRGGPPKTGGRHGANARPPPPRSLETPKPPGPFAAHSRGDEHR